MTFQDKLWQMLTSSRQPQLICASFGPLENMGHGCHGIEEAALIFWGSPGDLSELWILLLSSLVMGHGFPEAIASAGMSTPYWTARHVR